MIFGSRASGPLGVALTADTAYVSEFRLGESVIAVKLTVPLDGLGRASGSQDVRATIYDGDGALVAASQPVTISAGQPRRWIDFTLQSPGSPGVTLAPGAYLLGVHAGATSGVARAWVTPGPTNRITDPSFEYDAIGVEPAAFDEHVQGLSLGDDVLAFEVTSNWARVGGKSLFMATTNRVDMGDAVGVVSQRIAVEEGTPLAARFSVNLTRGVSAWPRIGVQFYDGGGARLDYVENTDAAPMTAPNVADVAAELGDVPAGAETAQLYYLLYSGYGSTQGFAFYLDALTAGVIDHRIYFDGDTSGYVWLGAPGASQSSVGRAFADTFVGGPVDSLVGVTGSAFPGLTILGTAIRAYAAPENVDDEYLMTLPFATAQRVLGTTQPLPGTETLAQCGWHGTLTDPERGSVAVVRTDGPLADLVGERVQISYEERTVVAYVHNELDVLDDISLPRRSFIKLALPSSESIAVTVSTLAGEEQT